MSEQENSQAHRGYPVADEVLAKLYLDTVSAEGSDRVRERARPKLDLADEHFSIERPSVVEIQSAIQERMANDQGLGGKLWGLTLADLAAFYGDKLKSRVEEVFDSVVADKEALTDAERQKLGQFVVETICGFGPLEPCLSDPAVHEVLVDGPDYVYVGRNGQLEDTPYRFRDEEHLMTTVHRIVMPLGRRLDVAHPILDARLPDGSRVNVVLPPISLIGPTLTILKHSKTPITWEQLLEWGSVSEDILEFLRACVRARANIVIAGGTGSGKTTLLNRVTELIPGDQRVVVIEHASEIQPSPHLDHIVRLETRPPNWEGKGEVTMRDLVLNALRMRPDRIICSEVYGGEVLDLVQAMNTGHDGTLINMHANAPYDALARMETMITMASTPLPLRAIREQIAAAIHLLVFQERLRDGTRKIVKVSEVVGVVDDVYPLQDIFEFRETGTQKGRVTGYHTATGNIPRLLSRMRDRGIELPMSMFTPSQGARRTE